MGKSNSPQFFHFQQQYNEHNTFVIDLLEYILKHNYFTFNNKYYHQLRGTVVGSTPHTPIFTLVGHNEQKDTKQIRLIGEFSREHKDITQILSKHWHILEQDRDLKQILGDRPLITFRRSRNLRDQLTHSHFQAPNKSTWLMNRIKGCYKFGKCLAYPFILKTTCVTGRMDIAEFKIAYFINCKTAGVVYIMKCACGKNYVGKTRRELKRRILEHVGDVKNKRNTSVATHINEIHDGDTGVVKFFRVEHFFPTTRVGDIDRKLLQCEVKRIYWLNSKGPDGLNEGFTFSPFL
ncbi:hypothetical protein XELAEV_18009502mg [Xenopus laevis]|uniref:GIY-YIG domain-containing protein n=1 Tax=Xenopus laevis TaxID=8355 RepID=A0A974I0H3_XENLA|nr:hypothetical protein XELAEV_18009502mg [Xenopus laevis]